MLYLVLFKNNELNFCLISLEYNIFNVIKIKYIYRKININYFNFVFL